MNFLCDFFDFVFLYSLRLHYLILLEQPVFTHKLSHVQNYFEKYCGHSLKISEAYRIHLFIHDILGF